MKKYRVNIAICNHKEHEYNRTDAVIETTADLSHIKRLVNGLLSSPTVMRTRSNCLTVCNKKGCACTVWIRDLKDQEITNHQFSTIKNQLMKGE